MDRLFRRLSALTIALQLILLGLQPGEQVDVSCTGQLGPVTTANGVVSVPCEAAPPPPPPGSVVPGDGIASSPSPIIIHQSSGFYVAGPGSAPRYTAGGAFQVDDRAGAVFTGLQCVLDSLEVVVGGDYRGGTNGQALIRVYLASAVQVTNGWDTPTPGWVALSVPQALTSADPVTLRRFAFIGSDRVPTAPGMWFAIDWLPTTNDTLNMLVVNFNPYDGQRSFLNDGRTLRTTTNQGVPLATPAFRIYEAC
jgi:hypothetical protein